MSADFKPTYPDTYEAVVRITHPEAMRNTDVSSLRLTAAIAVGLSLVAMAAASPTPTTSEADNLTLVGEFPLAGTFSVQFSSRAPVAYAYARHSGGTLVTLDISDPAQPVELGRVPVLAALYMEDMDLGERPDGTTFVLVRGVSGGLQIVDVTDPAHPVKSDNGEVGPPHVHTWSCGSPECWFAYGASDQDFSAPFQSPIVDLRDLDHPKVLQPHVADYGFHDLNADRAGVLWGAGREGIYALSAKKPSAPTLLNSSNENGPWAAMNPYNNQLHLHGTLRPNADRFRDDGPVISTDSGNVLLASEEGNDQDCTDSFHTWHVPHLDPTRIDTSNPIGHGHITPLDDWSLATDTTAGVSRPLASDFCSVHWFDYHHDGFVALAAYGAGTRVLDVRDPFQIREIGYLYEPGAVAMQSYWVPERNAAGRATGRASNLIYTADAGSPVLLAVAGEPVIGGIRILRAALP